MANKFTLNKCLKMLKEYNDRIIKISEEAVKEVFKDLDIPEVDCEGRKVVKASKEYSNTHVVESDKKKV